MITTRKPVFKICLNCKLEFKGCRNSLGKYCSVKCQQEFQFEKKYSEFIKNKSNVFLTSTSIRRALTKAYGYKCAVCGISKWQNKPFVLEVDHIDGHHENHYFKNLRLICPNCNSQTDTYKARNKGNGRKNRRKKK